MGMLDNEFMLADGQAVTAVGDTASTNVYDTGGTNGQGDLGQTNERLWLNIRVDTTVTSGGAATVTGVIQTSDDNVTYTDLVAGKAFALASLTAGTDLLRVQPPPIAPGSPSRYYRAVIRVGTAALTAGTFSAYASNTIQRNIARNSAFSVA
jgi:hypothetical protein